MILQRDQQAFEKTQRCKRHDQNQRQPHQRVQPIRRVKKRPRDQGGENHDATANQDDKYRGSIAGIGKTVIESAALAGRTQRQEALEKMSLAATRAASAQAAADRQFPRRCLIGHGASETSKQKGGAMTPPPLRKYARWSLRMRRTGSPYVYAGEQEQPYHVDEVPVPCGELEAEVLFRREVAGSCAQQTDDQEDRADDHVCAVKTGRHEERGAVDIAAEVEVRVRIFVGLHAGEGEAKQNGENQAPFQALPVILKECVMRPGHRRARS